MEAALKLNAIFDIHFHPTAEILLSQILRRYVENRMNEIPYFVKCYIQEMMEVENFMQLADNDLINGLFYFGRKVNDNFGRWTQLSENDVFDNNHVLIGRETVYETSSPVIDDRLHRSRISYMRRYTLLPEGPEEPDLYILNIDGDLNSNLLQTMAIEPIDFNSFNEIVVENVDGLSGVALNNLFGLRFEPRPRTLIKEILLRVHRGLKAEIPRHVYCYFRLAPVYGDDFFSMPHFQRTGSFYFCTKLSVPRPYIPLDHNREGWVCRRMRDVGLAGYRNRLRKERTQIVVDEYGLYEQWNDDNLPREAIYHIVSSEVAFQHP